MASPQIRHYEKSDWNCFAKFNGIIATAGWLLTARAVTSLPYLNFREVEFCLFIISGGEFLAGWVSPMSYHM